MYVYKVDDADASKSYYSKQDYDAMKYETVRAAMDVRSTVSTNDLKGLGCIAIGIEHLIAPGNLEKIVADRKRCRTAVLKEQMAQRNSGRYDPNRIAYASWCQSKRAAKQSRRIGARAA